MKDKTTINRPPDQIRRDINDYVPEYYEDFPEITEILDSRAEESIRLAQMVDETLDQFFIETATWAMSEYERIYGVTYNSGLTIDERRSVIISKMRGAGTASAERIRQVAESYADGEVSVENNHADYLVTITFIGERGVPTNLDDVKQALRDVVPAHLVVEFKFTFLTWEELDGFNITWETLDALQLTWTEFERSHEL